MNITTSGKSIIFNGQNLRSSNIVISKTKYVTLKKKRFVEFWLYRILQTKAKVS